ncbi:uncharacterized protein TNCV_1849011 [Trichonephila clavipes]|nr:uncharacterized protein TNCV_1849011 [Trichonephila clavipes]
MITNFFIPELNNHDVQKLWFQQDGATCHTARATIDLLKDTFGDRLISRFGPVNWPPRSCDLTPLDYFLEKVEITDFDQSIPGFQEGDEEVVETWMACDAEDCGFQMLNDDEIVTSVREESDPVDDETDEDEDNNNNEIGKSPSNADVFSALEKAME